MRQLKHLSLLLGLLLLGPSTYAQSVRFQSQAISSRGAGIANATVAVCTQPANTNTQPCSPLATLATSISTTSGGANPLTADSFGNFFFYAAPGRYTVQIYGPAVSGQFVIVDVEMPQTTGPNNQVLCKNFENIQCVDSLLLRGGTDIGNEINLAYAALPPQGGAIYIYPNPTSTCYSYSTPIVMTTSGKFVRLVGMGATGQGNGNGTQTGMCLNYTPTTATVAISLDVPAASSTQGPVWGLENIHLINNGCSATGGCGSSAFGIQCGTTNLGCTGAHFDNIGINGFSRAVNNTGINSSNMVWTNLQAVGNGAVFRLGNNTGNMLYGGTIAGNVSAFVADASGSAFSLDLFGVQFFGNTNTFDCTNVVGAAPCIVNGYDLHLEQSSGNPHFAQGDFDLNLHGGVAEQDDTVGTKDWMFNCSGNNIFIAGMVFTTGGSSLTNIALMNSPCRATIQGEIKNPLVGKITSICGGTNAANCSIQLLNGASSNSPLTVQWESPLQAGGTQPVLTGTGACATITTQLGGSWAGSGKCTAATAASTLTITFGATAPNGYVCDVWDETTRANVFQQTSHSITTCVLTITSVTQNDVFVFKAIAF